MYIPPPFAQSDLSESLAIVDAHPFALLVSQDAGAPLASHLPLLLDREFGQRGALIGHVARENTQWRSAGGQSVLAVFSGPHAYVSPRHYETPKAVPTWNYIAVHIYGRFEIVSDPVEVVAQLERMASTFEAGVEQPWRVSDAGEVVPKLLSQLVAFRIPVERVEGKFKLGQNHSTSRRQSAIAGLSSEASISAQEIAARMTATL